MHKEFWWENLRESVHFEYLCVDKRIMLKWIYKEWDGGEGSG
jgi:hypothetical protein